MEVATEEGLNKEGRRAGPVLAKNSSQAIISPSLAESRELADRVLAGDRRGVARLISLIEDDSPEACPALALLYPHTGRAHVVGVTGAPGTGKSTLVGQLARESRQRGLTVGIVAVDPSSPFSGGAILGDRIRMQELTGDPGVFIRSMATRGSLGGLSWATGDAIKVLDAFGRDIIYVETVGVGQDEVEIAATAHTTIVVEAPGLGDDIQAIKAGILEIADILVVNKADQEGAERTVAALQLMLELNHQPQGWQPPIIKTVAVEGKGIEALSREISRHRDYLQVSGRASLLRQHLAEEELWNLIRKTLVTRIMDKLDRAELDQLIRDIADRRLDPHTAANKLIAQILE
jgi:LAO/AO transport system kinase